MQIDYISLEVDEKKKKVEISCSFIFKPEGDTDSVGSYVKWTLRLNKKGKLKFEKIDHAG